MSDERDPSEAHPPRSLRLGFVRGVAPAKWARRWAEARPDLALELLPLAFNGTVASAQSRDAASPSTSSRGVASPDVILERVMPGSRPAGAESGARGADRRMAVRLYVESVALVVAADHELATHQEVDLATLGLLSLLDHPDHAPEWPAATAWEDPAWMPKHAGAAMDLVASGTGVILLPLPLARNLSRVREHVVLPVIGESATAGAGHPGDGAHEAEIPGTDTGHTGIPGTEIWASWAADRDDDDVQQLIGVMRGRTARSSRSATAPTDSTTGAAASGAASRKTGTSASGTGKSGSTSGKSGSGKAGSGKSSSGKSPSRSAGNQRSSSANGARGPKRGGARRGRSRGSR